MTYEAYGYRLLGHLLDDPRRAGKNAFVSPLSAGMAFSLALAGADGSTRTSLARALDVAPDRESELHRANFELLAAMDSPDLTFTVANSLWGRQDAPFIPSFVADAGRWYGAEVTPVDFRDRATAGRINDWASHQTHGRIQNIVPAEMDTTLVLMLVNAVYFKGKWAGSFDAASTRPEAFHRADGGVVQVPMMHGRVGGRLAQGPGFRVARLAYRGDRFAMYVFLPDSGRAPRDVLAAVARGWRWQGAEWRYESLQLSLPRFTLRDNVDLIPPMTAMGAGVAFKRLEADFTRALPRTWLTAGRNASLGSAQQNTFVQVDEEGTEAAAVTGLGMLMPTGVIDPVRFIVDHPFIVMIRDDRTGALLFIGSIEDPTVAETG